MEKWIKHLKMNDWSLNLEDVYYEEHPEELMLTAVEAVKTTAPGHYVNLVTPACYGNPASKLIPDLTQRLSEENVPFIELRYIDECGCGGHVTRVYR